MGSRTKTLTPQQYIRLAADERVTVKRHTIDNQPFPPTHLASVVYPDYSVEVYEWCGGREEWQLIADDIMVLTREGVMQNG